MRTSRCLALAVTLSGLMTAWSASDLQAQPVGKEEAARWTRWVIPLPHEIAIERKAVAAASELVITLTPDATPLEHAAATELAEAFTKITKVKVTPGAEGGKDSLQLLLGRCTSEGKLAGRDVPGAARLFSLPCPDQAYRIVPLGDRTLALVGTKPQGVYYAVKTLAQLVTGTPAAPDRVTVPLASITDWPDIAERGLWGGSANEDIEWLAQWKMNLVESHVRLTINSNGRGEATIPEKLIPRSQQHGVKLVPIITHLEQLPPDVLARCPELRATGDEAAWRRIGEVRPVCFSQPKAREILDQWMTCLARYPEVTDVNVWLSENSTPCRCPKCSAVNPFVLQTQLILHAWQAAKEVRPDLHLRILLTQGSYTSNDQVLAHTPRNVGITYYDGGRTYDSSREPMIYPLLEKYAAEGRWLGCYPQLTASWRIVCPWSGPQFIKARMTEFAGKRLQCLCGYATPSNRFYDFNVTAAAEWSWNSTGRSEREFALAWATRQGLAEPEKAADWAVTLGPVGWDLYGSRVPYLWVYPGVVGNLLRAGKAPQLGKGIFTYFPTKEHFDSDLAECDRAMALAQAVQSPALIEETRTLRGLVVMLKGIYTMAEAMAPGKKMTPNDRQRAADSLVLLDRASQETRESLLAWGHTVAPRIVPKSAPPRDRFGDTADCLEAVVTEAGDVAVRQNVPDPGRPYRPHIAGHWTTEDFRSGSMQKKIWDVTSFVTGPGRYQVTFSHDRGWHGAGVRQLVLVASPVKDGMQQTELARDTHHGATGYQPKNTTYELVLSAHDPKQHYFLVADLTGPAPNTPPERATCVGHAALRQIKEANK